MNRPAPAAKTAAGSVGLAGALLRITWFREEMVHLRGVAMRTYRVDSKTVRLEASDDAESVVLEVSRSRAYRDDPPVISSNYARAMRTGPGGSSSSSHAANVAARPGTSEAAAAGIRRYRIKLSD